MRTRGKLLDGWRRPRYRPGCEFVNGKIAKIALKRLDQRKQEASRRVWVDKACVPSMEFENSIIGKTIDQSQTRPPTVSFSRMLWKFDNIKRSEHFLQLEQQRRERKQDEQGQPSILKEHFLVPIEALRVSFEIQEDVSFDSTYV